MHITYKNRQVLDMIEQDFEDFEKDRESRKGLKTMMDLDSTRIEYEGTKMQTKVAPKFKAKIKSSVYIKQDPNNKNSLF